MPYPLVAQTNSKSTLEKYSFPSKSFSYPFLDGFHCLASQEKWKKSPISNARRLLHYCHFFSLMDEKLLLTFDPQAIESVESIKIWDEILEWWKLPKLTQESIPKGMTKDTTTWGMVNRDKSCSQWFKRNPLYNRVHNLSHHCSYHILY